MGPHGPKCFKSMRAYAKGSRTLDRNDFSFILVDLTNCVQVTYNRMGFNISKLKIISFLILFSSRRCLFPVKVWFLESRSNWIYASPEIYSDISPDLYCSIEWLTSTWRSFTPPTLKIARIVNVTLYKHRALGGLAFFLSRIRPPVSYTLHLALEYVAVLPPSVIRLLVSIV